MADIAYISALQFCMCPTVGCCVFLCLYSASLYSFVCRRIFHQVPDVRPVYLKGSHPLWGSHVNQERERTVRRFVVVAA